MLTGVEIDEITVMVKHVDAWKEKQILYCWFYPDTPENDNALFQFQSWTCPFLKFSMDRINEVW